MLSSAARAMCAAVVPRVMPTIVPRAIPDPSAVRRGRQTPGTRYTPPLSGTLAASGSISAAVRIETEAVANPLHHRAADEHAALERVLGAPADLPGDGRHQLLARRDRRRADVLQQEAAGAVGVLRHAGRAAHLTEQRRLLIARDAGDWHARRCRASTTTWPYTSLDDRTSGSRLARHIEQPQQFVVPFQRVNVEQHRARGVADVGHVRRPPVSFQISHVSIVPNASLPASARARAPGTLSSSQRILLAEKYASMSSPVFA